MISQYKHLKELLLSGSDRTAKMSRNIFGSVLIKIISIFISFFIVPLTLDFVDKELYGIWLILSSVVIWLNFFDIGFATGLRNKLVESIAFGDWGRARLLVSSTYAVLGLIFIPLMLLFFLLIPLVDWCTFLNIKECYRDDVVMTLYPLVACFCLQMVLAVITTVVISFQKTALSNLFGVIANLLSLLIIIFLPYATRPSLFALSLAISTTPIIVLTVSSIFLYKKWFEKVRPSWRYVDFAQAKDIFTLGGKFFVLQIQGTILYYTTNVLISNISNPIDVSVYNIAYKYLSCSMMFYSIIMGPLWPAFTEAYTLKDFEWMKKTYRRMGVVCLMVFFSLVIMVAFSSFVYDLWIGNKISIPFYMTVFVAIYIALFSWKQLQDTLINGIGKIKLSTYVSCVGLIFYIPLAFFLGKYYSALGVVIAMIIIHLIYSFIYTYQINLLISNKATGIWNK